MLNTNILQRVFRICVGKETGSSYTIEKGESQYLVSASHIFKEYKDVSEILIFHEDKWKKIKVKPVFNIPEHGDTIVFKLAAPISPKHKIKLGIDNIVLGTNAYILGFPFGLSNKAGHLNNNFPIPFVKGGLISALDSEAHGVKKIYIDGHNNKGFSGGPVVTYQGNSKIPQIIGTVSGYISEHPEVAKTKEEWDLLLINSGIILTHWIDNLLDNIPDKI